MKKIGIITFWGVPNYGAWMQAYALNKVISAMDKNNEVRHIAYLDDFHFEAYYGKDERLLNAFTYSWDIIPHTIRLDAKQLEKEPFDMVVTGSDSIWEFSSETTNDDIHLIGNKLCTSKLISYAASAGVSAICNDKWFVKEGLKKYDHISVRDEATQKMVFDKIGKYAPIVLDPSLLYDFRNDSQISSPVFKDYIFVYGVIWDDNYIDELIRFAKKRNLKLISCGYINSWCDISLRMVELRTFEWLGLIRDSAYVATSMFHGLMLGVSMKKKVFFYSHEYVENRSSMLVNLLGIPFWDKNSSKKINDLELFDLEWDCDSINQKLDEAKADSENILKKMIED